MNLDTSKWEYFNISRLFEVEAGNYYYQDDYSIGNTPYCSASAENNGVSKKIDIEADFLGNKIIAGKVGCTTFYQEFPFCATSDVNVMTPKFNMTKEIGLFITTVINKNENYRWNYGRQCRIGNTKKINIKLPICRNLDDTPILDEHKTFSDSGYVPDWEWMEKYIKSLNSKRIRTNVKSDNLNLNISTWKEYILDKLFDFKKGTRLIKEDMEEGSTNYLGAISNNNGVRQKIKCDDEDKYEPNCITVNYNGSVGEAFYQEKEFWASDDVNVLYAKDWWTLNKYIAMFIITVIKANKYKFDYGRKWTMEKMKASTILLPADNDGLPNWIYMEEYIKSLPYSDRI